MNINTQTQTNEKIDSYFRTLQGVSFLCNDKANVRNRLIAEMQINARREEASYFPVLNFLFKFLHNK